MHKLFLYVTLSFLVSLLLISFCYCMLHRRLVQSCPTTPKVCFSFSLLSFKHGDTGIYFQIFLLM